MSKIIFDEKVSKRLDLFMMQQLPQISRSTFRKLITSGIVKLNGQEAMPNNKVTEGDVVEFEESEIETYIKEEGGVVLSPYKFDLKVLYEDEYTLAVSKPSGMNSHPVTKNDKKSLLNAVVYYFQTKSIANKPRLLHRLDKETSGVVLVSKALDAHDYYSNLFKNRNVKKDYILIVKGDFLSRHGSEKIVRSSFLSQQKNDKSRYFETVSSDGRFAKTEFVFQRYFNRFGKKKFSVIKASPMTGRSHQIRVHVESLGFPILGDVVYGGDKYSRMMLHAYSLQVKLFKSSKSQKIISDLPEDFF